MRLNIKFLSLIIGSLLISVGLPTVSVAEVVTAQVQRESDRNTEAEALLDLCREQLGKEQFDAAIGSCREAMEVYQGIDDRSGEVKSMTNLGIAYLSNGKFEEGIATLEKSLAIAREVGERRVEVIAMQWLGIAYFSLKESQKGTDFLEQALTIAEEIGEAELAQGIQEVLLSVEEIIGSPQKVEADKLLQQGIEQFQTSRYREAQQSWQKALEIYREIGDRNGEANSIMNLGLTYQSLGDYPKSISYFEQSLAIFQQIDDRNGEARSLNNLGLVTNH